MKNILELTVGEFGDALAETAVSIENISSNPAFIEAAKAIAEIKSERQFFHVFGSLWGKIVPPLLTDNRKDVLKLLSVILGKPAEEIEKESFLHLTFDFKRFLRYAKKRSGSFTDED